MWRSFLVEFTYVAGEWKNFLKASIQQIAKHKAG